MDNPTTSLSSLLLELGGNTLKTATKHPFLLVAGRGVLPLSMLQHWLVQDCHYIRAYIKFVGALLSKLELPLNAQTADQYGRPETKLQFRIFNLLLSALSNVQREMAFFEETAKKYDLGLDNISDEDAQLDRHTRMYVDLFSSVGNSASAENMLDGLVLLWATEWAYLNAWSYAETVRPFEIDEHTNEGQINCRRALREAFMPNWTCWEFQKFVEECRQVMDAIAMERAKRASREWNRELRRCRETFEQTMWLEARFWPEVNDLLIEERQSLS